MKTLTKTIRIWNVKSSSHISKYVKKPIPDHEVLPLIRYIFETSYSTSATQVNKI